MTALRMAGATAVLLSALLWRVPANAQAYVPAVTCPSGQAMTAYTPQTGITCGVTVVRSYLAGLILSNDATTPNTVLDIAAGLAADSTNANMIALGSAFTKSTGGAWAAGSGNNAMGAGLTVTASTWYHVFLIVKGGAADIYFDTSATAANAPGGTTYFRRIGSFETDSSAHILGFSQNGDEFLWANSNLIDVNTSSLGTTATLETVNVPTGVTVNAILKGYVSSASAAVGALVNSPSETSVAGGSANFVTAQTSVASKPAYWGLISVRTNTSAQVRAVAVSASTTLSMSAIGWIDRRGRDG